MLNVNVVRSSIGLALLESGVTGVAVEVIRVNSLKDLSSKVFSMNERIEEETHAIVVPYLGLGIAENINKQVLHLCYTSDSVSVEDAVKLVMETSKFVKDKKELSVFNAIRNGLQILCYDEIGNKGVDVEIVRIFEDCEEDMLTELMHIEDRFRYMNSGNKGIVNSYLDRENYMLLTETDTDIRIYTVLNRHKYKSREMSLLLIDHSVNFGNKVNEYVVADGFVPASIAYRTIWEYDREYYAEETVKGVDFDFRIAIFGTKEDSNTVFMIKGHRIIITLNSKEKALAFFESFKKAVKRGRIKGYTKHQDIIKTLDTFEKRDRMCWQ